MSIEGLSGSPGEMETNKDWIERDSQTSSKKSTDRSGTDGFTRGAERELLDQRVEASVKAVKLAEAHGARGLPVDVPTTSSRDPGGEKLFEKIYEDLGLASARDDTERREIIGEGGKILGDEYTVLGRDDVSITDVQYDDPQAAAATGRCT